MAESKEKLKSLLMKMEQDNGEFRLKLNTQKKQKSWHPVPSLQGK